MLNIAVVGGGASGLLSAVVLAQKGHHVTLFEANARVGKKILASGNGHCNISNAHISLENYDGLDPQFPKHLLETFSFKHLEKLFKSFGLLFDIKEDGKVYPLSYEAKSVVENLLMTALNYGVTIHNSQKIVKIDKDETFVMHSATEMFSGFHKLILAAGSPAASQLGGNDSGYVIAESFGHTITPAYPSLVQLELDGNSHESMAGVKQFGEVSLYIDNTLVEKRQGDVLFTRYGISGLAILDLSQKASFALSLYSTVDIVVNLFPKFDRQRLDSQIQALCRQLPQATFLTLLSGIIHSKIISEILNRLLISKDIKAAEMDSKMIKKVVNLLINWKFHVTQTHGFKYAEVSGGGVLTSEINPKTMQSLKDKDLYIVGEVLDVVGERGGYNFHFAWASAYCASQAIISEFNSQKIAK